MGREGARSPVRLAMRDALADLFDVPREAIDAVRIVEQSNFARLHGRGVIATTRRNAIYLAGSRKHFFEDPGLVLHEYFHVLRQWDTGAMTPWSYVGELLRHGYRDNRYEVEARAFARRHAPEFVLRLRPGHDATV